MKKSKEVLIVTLLSIMMVVIANGLLLLDKNSNKELLLFYHILFSIWSFSFIPSFKFVISWLEKKSFEEGAKIGGYLRFHLIIFPILIAPYFMVKYYIDIYECN